MTIFFNKLVLTLLLIIAFLMIGKVFNLSIPLKVENSTKNNEFSVVGEGKIEAIPDIAKIDTGIQVNDIASVEMAQNQINKINNDIVKALEQLQINKNDITTSNYSIYPNITYDQSGKPTTRGYSGNVTISIRVRNIQKVGEVLTAATKAGANQIQGTSYSIDHPEKLREEARNLAIKNAREQADKLAKNLGFKLKKVTNIIESSPDSVGGPVFAIAEKNMGGGGGAPADFSSGVQTITSVVTLFFEKN